MYHLTQNDQAILIIMFLTLALIGGIVSMLYILKYQEAKRQSETDSGVIARNLQRIIQIETEKEVIKSSFSELAVENRKLKDVIKDLSKVNYNLKAKLSRKNQPRDSHGHFVKVKPVESDWWECLNSEVYFQFDKGKQYKQDKTIICTKPDIIWLFEHEDHLHPYLVERKYFKPCKNSDM